MPSPPHLPPELEYDIFLLAFHNDPKNERNLVLVAKRVFDWLIPHRFHIVTLSDSDGESYPIEFNETTYQRYGHHVRHLFIQELRVAADLDLFPNVVNLGFWIDYEPTHLPFLLKLPLTRISADPSPELFQVFSNVTHLDLLSLDISLDEITSVLHLPKLTHVCVMCDISHSALNLFLEKERCPGLRVVVLWSIGVSSPVLGEHEGMKTDDKRIVLVRCAPSEDWQTGARGGLDMWKFAEQVIASRNVPGT
ncbi:hypothetical protein BDN72DRAFT_846576 [Pluteus cervinus]|uniref:Uncharacterized protein n=1 Tax=Pluteus cervinus TaxID=181527 RepID=A0ACD3AEX7_9AGAR|nr:hypothetical protein BDN72DRAFT_846576 [Pluteus cervinus]